MPLCCTVPPLNQMAHIGCAPSLYPLKSQLTHQPTLHPMPRLFQPGGVLRRMHVRYTAQCKLALLTMAKRLRDKEGISLRKSAERVQVSDGLLVKREERFSLGNNPIKALLKTKKKSIHPGPLGQLKLLKEALLKYIFKQCKQGIEVSTLSIVVVASNISTKFGKKDFIARCSTIKCFVHAHSFVYQMGRHLCQHKPEEVETEASNYMHLICTLLLGPHRDRRFILNMDQTPLYFLMSMKRMLELVGKITIHIRTSTNDTRQVTMAVTIAGDGMVLPLMIIFKGKHDGRIAHRAVNAPLVDRGACTTFPVGNGGGGGHDGRVMRAGCEGLVVRVWL
jgi:hypothetical protein